MFIKSAAEMGILGVGALIWFFYIFFRDLTKSFLNSRGQTRSVIVLAFLLAALAGFLMNLTTNIFTKEFTWTIWGLAYAAVLMSTEMENLPPESQQLRTMT
jgi:O-antigen/teichoic acid export membrane protein